MLIVCPSCASEYEIAADRLGAKGRSVRCAACRETWFIAPDLSLDTESMAEAVAEPSSPAADSWDAEPAAEIDMPTASSAPQSDDAGIVEQPRPRARGARSGRKAPARAPARRALSPALAAGLVAFAIVPLALLGRGTVVRAMPQTAGIFAGVGLPMNVRGVSIRDVAAFQTPAEGDKPAKLVVEGDLVGVARERVDVPDLAVEVRDEHDQPLHRWTVPSPRAALESGETARFKATLAGPPALGRAVQVRFADAQAAEHPAVAAGQAEPSSEAAAPGADPHHVPEHGH